MQQILQPDAESRLTNVTTARGRRTVRSLIGVGLVGVALSWLLVTDMAPLSVPGFGLFV